MNSQAAHHGRCPEVIQVLTFDVMGVKMGVDTEQIAAVMDLDDTKKQGQAMHHVYEKISFGPRKVDYGAPKALLIRDGGTSYTVVVDHPDDITVLPIQSIQPLPPLLASQRGSCAFWGAVAHKNGIILLIDFTKMGIG